MMIDKWDKRFLIMAEMVSTWSKDPSTQCGAVLTRGKEVISLGFNGFPKNTYDGKEIYADRPRKYKRVIHAEQNAVLFAKRDLTDATCYVYPMPPCSNCAALLIQSGIKRIVTIQPSNEQLERWGYSFREANEMYKDAGVELDFIIDLREK